MLQLRFVVSIVALVLFAADVPASAAETFWSGRSAGFLVEWSDRDLAVRTANHETLFSAAAQAVKQVAAASTNAKTLPCQFRQQLRLLSLVGPFLAFEERDYRSCEGWAHPAEEARFRTIDLRRSSAKQQWLAPPDISLMEFFPANDVAKALRDNPVVRRAIDGEPSHDLTGLLTQLSIEARPPEGTCFRFPTDLLSRFAFYDVTRGQALIRLSLPGLGPCRANLTELTLMLPLRSADGGMFAAAKTRQAGILMIEAERLFGRSRTKISVDYRVAP